MKFTLVVLALFVASVVGIYTNEYKSIRFHDSFVYKYRYSGQVLTGIPSVSDRYSGYHLTTDILLQNHGDDVISMQLTNVTLGQAEREVFNVEDVKFETKRTESLALEAELSKPVTFQMKEGLFVWLQADSQEAAWSLNMKKSIIDLFQVDIEAKKPIHGQHWGQEDSVRSEHKNLVYYGVYEKGIKGICETTYERSSALDTSRVNYVQGQEHLVLNITKTRNYENCLVESTMVRDNFDRKGCAVYCRQVKSQQQLHAHQQQQKQFQDLNKYLPIPDEAHTNMAASGCSCDDSPVDQYSTVKYNITYDAASPTIEGIWSEGKVTIDNHGTQFAVLTHQRVHFVGQSARSGGLPETTRNPIKYESLTFTTYNQTSQGKAVGHEIPFYNLFVPPTPQELIVNSVEMMKEVARQVIAGELTKENERTPWYVTRFIQNLAYLDSDKIEIIYEKLARLSGRTGAYTNTLISVQRQLFLDALPYVGTNEAARWILQSIERGHFTQWETRQLIESLPRNYYFPAKSVLNLFARKIETLADTSDKHQLLAAFTVTFAKLVAKSCVNHGKAEWSPEYRDLSEEWMTGAWSSIESQQRTTTSFPRYTAWKVEEICRKEDADQYVTLLGRLMDTSKTFHTKMIFAQGLVHTGHYTALQMLEPYIIGTVDHQRPCPGYLVINKTKVHEECNFFRTAVIYALHNMIPQNPKLIRSMVLPVYRNTEEAYELRIAAFTVFLASGPLRHELESVASGLRHENNRQVIYMVSSILENAANLTAPCNQPLAEAVQQILPSLPKINLDGYYSRANWNEWYSEDKKTGFYANGQFVANNVSFIPRAGYLSLGSTWGSFQSGWFSLAFQQKGFEKLFWTLLKPQVLLRELAALMVRDPSVQRFPETRQEENMDRVFEKLGIVPRVDEDPKAKIFFKLYEQTSLWTLDEQSLRDLYEQFSQSFIQWSGQMMRGGDFHWVRFYMPASYQQIVSNDLGLPVLVTKQRPHIVALKIENTKFDLLRAPAHKMPVGFNFSAIVTPQLLYTSAMSVSTLHQGINNNIGVSTLKKTFGVLPVQLSFGYNMAKDLVTFSAVPQMGKTIIRQKTLSRSFLANNQVGLPTQSTPFYSKQELTSLPAPFKHETVFGHPAIGMDLAVKVSTHRPWFFNPQLILKKGWIPAMIEKYHELNQFNHRVDIIFKPNDIVPVHGFQGTLKYKFALTKVGEQIRYTPDGDFDWTRYQRLNEVFGSEWTKKAVDISKKIAVQSQYYDDANVLEYDEILERIIRKPRQDVPLETKVTEMIEKSRNIWAWSYPAGHKMNDIVLTRNLIWTLWTISPEPVFAAGNLYYTRTVNHQTHWIKAETWINGGHRFWSTVPNVWSVEGIFAHQQLPNELVWDPIEGQNHQAKFAVVLGYGDQAAEESLKIAGSLERTPDKVLSAEKFAFQAEPWFVQQCHQDKAQGKSLSYPCQLAAWQQAYFNHVDIDIDWKNVPESWVNYTTTLNTLVKAWYFPWVSVNTLDVHNVEGHLDVTIDHSNRIEGHPMVNVEVRSPRETASYKMTPAFVSRLPNFFPPMYTKVSTIKDQTCALMENHVRTFDNVTYSKPVVPCEYVLAMDCSQLNRFAVLVNEQSVDQKSVKIIVRGHEIYIAAPTRAGDKVDVKIDGQQYTVEANKPIVLHRQLELFSIKIFLQPIHHKGSLGHNVVIEMPLETFRVVTNGKHVKVTTGLVYSGKTCGLCGNSDHEAEEEFQAPVGSCVYEHPEDFLFSYTLGDCRKPSHTFGPVKCAGKPTYWSYPDTVRRDTTDKVTFPVERKNLIIVEGDKKCFSRYSVPACAQGETVQSTQQWPVDFVCVRATGHPVYSQWLSDAGSRLIHELNSFEKTMTKVMEVPKTCVRGL